MGEGVPLSLPRDGFPVANHLVVSVPFSREHGYSGGINVPDIQAEEGVSLPLPRNGFPATILIGVSVPSSREHGFSGGSNLPDFQAAIGAGMSFPKWSDEDSQVDSSHSTDLKETDRSCLFPVRSKEVGRLGSSSIGRGEWCWTFSHLYKFLILRDQILFGLSGSICRYALMAEVVMFVSRFRQRKSTRSSFVWAGLVFRRQCWAVPPERTL